MKFFAELFQCFDNVKLQLQHIESTYHYFFGFIAVFLLFNHSGESVYDPPYLDLFYEICNVID